MRMYMYVGAWCYYSSKLIRLTTLGWLYWNIFIKYDTTWRKQLVDCRDLITRFFIGAGGTSGGALVPMRYLVFSKTDILK